MDLPISPPGPGSLSARKPQNGAPEMLRNKNWQPFPFKLPNWRKSHGGPGKVNAMCHLGVMTQLVRCPQLCSRRSSGRQMEGRWARRVGTGAPLGRVPGSQRWPQGSRGVSARLALLSGSLECHPLVTEPGVGC